MSEDEGEQYEYQIREVRCPSCEAENAKFITHLLDIPYYEDFLMVNINCPECGYRSTDFMNTQSKGHTIYRYHVDLESDDETKVVRATESTVSIPELGIKIEPVGDGTSWIRNIEGILDDIKEKLYITLDQTDDMDTKRLVKQRIKTLNRMSRYQMPFTIEVDDPNGNSIILPADRTKLQKEILSD
jgi:zinc finger protein